MKDKPSFPSLFLVNNKTKDNTNMVPIETFLLLTALGGEAGHLSDLTTAFKRKLKIF